MKSTTKLIASVVLTAASSLAMAEGGSDRTLKRLDEATEAKPTLKAIGKRGPVWFNWHYWNDTNL